MIEYVPVSDLAASIFPVGTTDRLMAMFTAYFDESGTHAASPAIAMAGYVADSDQWSRFQAEWEAWLHHEKFQIDYFHMTDWEAKEQQFKGWDDEKRIDLFMKLVGTLRRRFRFGFSAATIIDAYQQYGPKFAPPNSAYTFCALQCMWFVKQWADRFGHDGPIAYIFEDGAGYKAEMLEVRRVILQDDEKRQRFRFGSLTFANKKTLNPLQGADILAYETWKEMCNFIVPGREVRPPRKTAEILFQDHERRYVHGYFDKEHFETSTPYVPSG